MWEVRTQWANPDFTGNAETSGVLVNTREEAESWWESRMRGRQLSSVVYTMYNPEGEVVRVVLR